jgi:dephospho-CoA kinase
VLLVGLTGGIGSGKSTVSALLAARGAVIVDADRIVHEIEAPDGPAYQPLIDRFGPGIVSPDGTLDRAGLAAVAFHDEQSLADLNAITHPLVRAEMARQVVAQAETDNVVVLDIPLLAEGTKAAMGLAGVLVVDTPVEIAVERLVKHRELSEADARARIANQASREDRRKLADVVVDNRGSLAQLEGEVDRAWAWIQSKLAELSPSS